MYLLRCLRFERGMNQKEAAAAIGIASSTLQNAEGGKSLSPKIWRQIINFYGIDKDPQYDQIVKEALEDVAAPKTRQRAKKGVKNTKKA